MKKILSIFLMLCLVVLASGVGTLPANVIDDEQPQLSAHHSAQTTVAEAYTVEGSTNWTQLVQTSYGQNLIGEVRHQGVLCRSYDRKSGAKKRHQHDLLSKQHFRQDACLLVILHKKSKTSRIRYLT